MGAIHGLRLNNQGIRATMRDPRVKAMLLERMKRVAQQANENAPVGETGELSQSHEAYVDDRPDTHLPAARVESSKDYALVVESRTGYLSSALDAAGGRDA